MILLPLHNPLLWPLALAVSVLDCYLAVMGLRVVLIGLDRVYGPGTCAAVLRLVDWPPQSLHAWLCGRLARPLPEWTVWLAVALAVLAARQVLASTVVSYL